MVLELRRRYAYILIVNWIVGQCVYVNGKISNVTLQDIVDDIAR